MRNKFLAPVLAAASLVVASLAASSSQASDGNQQMQTLHDRWAAAMQELHLPGLAVAVVQNDKVAWVDALGVCDAQSKRPVTADSPFYIASSTKSFTAMAVAILVDEGRIKLDDPVKQYLPRLQLGDEKLRETITIRDLLAHRCGIDSGPISTCEAYTGLINDDRYYRLLAKVRGTGRFRYSNLNFTLAGRVVQAVSGQTWQQFIAERILTPGGMHRSTCLASKLYADPGAALPTVEIDGQWQTAPTRKVDTTMHAAGGMGASANDLARWLRLNLNQGSIDGQRLVSQALMREMQSPQVSITVPSGPNEEFKDRNYGLGWFLGEYRGRSAVYHFGGYVGARCHISFLPQDQVGIAVLMNASGPAGEFPELVAADIYDALLGLEPIDRWTSFKERVKATRERMAQRPRPLERPPTADQLSRPIESYAGRYEHEDHGDVQIRIEDGRMMAQLGAHRARLTATEVDHFEGDLIPNDRYKCEFQFDGEGQVVGLLAKSLLHKFLFVRQP